MRRARPFVVHAGGLERTSLGRGCARHHVPRQLHIRPKFVCGKHTSCWIRFSMFWARAFSFLFHSSPGNLSGFPLWITKTNEVSLETFQSLAPLQNVGNSSLIMHSTSISILLALSQVQTLIARLDATQMIALDLIALFYGRTGAELQQVRSKLPICVPPFAALRCLVPTRCRALGCNDDDGCSWFEVNVRSVLRSSCGRVAFKGIAVYQAGLVGRLLCCTHETSEQRYVNTACIPMPKRTPAFAPQNSGPAQEHRTR
eukprot:1965257-Pleurochrysis_carterae.AAC.6